MEPPSPVPERSGEQRLIDLVLAAAPFRRPLLVPPGDDAAVLPDGTVLTVDVLVEGVHWNDRLDPSDVGWKAIAVNASDVGAMGGEPRYALLALSVPRADERWVAAFAAGLGEACRYFGVDLVGGDTTRTPGAATVGVTMIGHTERPVTRGGGRPGDRLWVTGVLGLAGVGYLHPDPPEDALRALRRPTPPVALGAELARRGVTAMMDLSDGLATDLPRLCAASGTGAVVDPAALPHHPALGPDPLQYQVAAGDDYELLFAAPPGLDLSDVATAIGELTRGPAVVLRDTAWPAPRFTHFGATER